MRSGASLGAETGAAPFQTPLSGASPEFRLNVRRRHVRCAASRGPGSKCRGAIGATRGPFDGVGNRRSILSTHTYILAAGYRHFGRGSQAGETPWPDFHLLTFSRAGFWSRLDTCRASTSHALPFQDVQACDSIHIATTLSGRSCFVSAATGF